MKNTTTLLLSLIEDTERRQKKVRKKMSKLTDAVAGLQAAVADLKARVDAQDTTDATTIANLTAENTTLAQENDDTSNTITDLTAQINAIDVSPIAPESLPAVPDDTPVP